VDGGWKEPEKGDRVGGADRTRATSWCNKPQACEQDDQAVRLSAEAFPLAHGGSTTSGRHSFLVQGAQ
jgi:hypothetical protein